MTIDGVIFAAAFAVIGTAVQIALALAVMGAAEAVARLAGQR